MITITVKIENLGPGIQMAVTSEAKEASLAEAAIAHIVNEGLIHVTKFLSERCKDAVLIGGKNVPPEIFKSMGNQGADYSAN
jgi:hypothetical protein